MMPVKNTFNNNNSSLEIVNSIVQNRMDQVDLHLDKDKDLKAIEQKLINIVSPENKELIYNLELKLKKFLTKEVLLMELI